MRPPAAPRPTGRTRDRRAAAEPTRGGTPEPAAAEETPPEPAARVVVPRREPRSVAVRRGVGSVSTGLRDRLAERDAAARRLLLRTVLLTLLALAVLAAVGWLLLASSVLALRAEEVTVAGTGTTVQPGDVHAAVEPAIGTPLARVDVGQVRERVAAVPNVRSAEVARDWPNGLTVQVVSREPVAASAEEQGYALLDRDGVRVGSVDAVPEELPEVTVPLADAEETGPALRAVLDVVDALPAPLLEQVAEAGARSDRTVQLVLDDGATVRWGTAQENELKAAVLEVLRAEQEAAVYDVSTPRAPTTSA